MKNKGSIQLVVLAAIISLIVACARTSDAGTTGLVKTKLAADGKVSAAEINVDTANGVVTLTGNVDSQEAKDQALKLAKETTGVHEVVDMIAVRTSSNLAEAPDPNLSVGEHIDDAGITMRVKSRLLDDPVVKGLKIDVDTRNGVVYLTGSVTSEVEKKQAVELARTTEGVKDVQANFL